MAASAAPAAAKKPEPKTLLKADTVMLSFVADKEGRIRVNCSSFETPAVIGKGQVLEASWKDGQVVLVHRPGAKR